MRSKTSVLVPIIQTSGIGSSIDSCVCLNIILSHAMSSQFFFGYLSTSNDVRLSTSGRTNVKFVRLVDPSTAEIRDAGMDRFKELLA